MIPLKDGAGTATLHMTRQFIIFIAVGVASALVDMALMQLLLSHGAVLWLAVAVGFAAGLLVNYLSHTKLTFRSTVSWRTGTRFAAIVAFNYAMTLGFVHAAQALSGSALAGKVVSLPFVAVAGFVASRTWVFK